ncbi:uncharacterized protein PADG_12159 [Paracoccidioides brasiliensis Pb18]|uniref:Uncharacterized protein n=1 Tax=Paracoccidioides brasiliensis (strain Pb18) TaxID=502780 RepID=A0A0A0HTU0_PARBD|nr:uncharacterized protein PADG_12159 [Paracoccidioides brasiliensis Pb18]KGM91703.1 hypothetical protein PADG_12159 [Paracoccidioides brasiliensis Pb18]
MYHLENAILPLSPYKFRSDWIFTSNPMHAPSIHPSIHPGSRYPTDVLGEDPTVDHTRIRSATCNVAVEEPKSTLDCSQPGASPRPRDAVGCATDTSILHKPAAA